MGGLGRMGMEYLVLWRLVIRGWFLQLAWLAVYILLSFVVG